MTQPYFGLVDSKLGSPWFAATGGFSPDFQGLRGGQYEAAAGTGTSSATYTFTGLPSATYKVYLTWPDPFMSFGSAATNAPFSVYDNTTLLATTRFDQSVVPSDLSANGGVWKLHGSYAVSSGTLKVVVTDDANSTVYADAVRVADASLDPTSLLQPTFTDNVADSHLYPSWYAGGAWTYNASGGVIVLPSGRTINQSYEWDRQWVEVLSKVRVDAWSGSNDSARVGVSLDSPGGTAYNMVFYGGYDNQTVNGVTFTNHDCVHFIDDGVAHGSSFHFTWAENAWYWFRFRRQGDNLYGSIWADGGTEPSSWLFTQQISGTFSGRTDGYPGLFGGGDTSTQGSFTGITISGPVGIVGTGAQAASHPSASGVGTYSDPYRGSGSLSKHPTVTGMGTCPVPHYTGTSSAAATHPSVAGSATAAPPHYTGSSSLSKHPVMAGAGTCPRPTYTGTGGQAATHPAIGGFGTRTLPTYTGVSSASATRPTLSSGRGQYITNHPVSLSITGSAGTDVAAVRSLFTSGSPRSNSAATNLFVANYVVGNSATLAVRGDTTNNWRIDGSADLSVTGHGTSSRSTTLFVKSPEPSSRSTTLFVRGPYPASEPMNLFVATDAAPHASGSATLYLAAVPNGRQGLVPLFVTGTDAGDTGSMNLYVIGGDTDTPAEVMNLYVRGGNPRAALTTPLYLRCEPVPGDYIYLSIQGQGVSPGFFPSSESMNLHVCRGPQGGIAMTLWNAGVVGSAPFSIAGAPAASGSATLYTAGDGGTPSGAATLFIPGRGPNLSTGTATLAVPHPVGHPTGSLTLYTGGWAGPGGVVVPNPGSPVLIDGFTSGRFITFGFGGH